VGGDGQLFHILLRHLHFLFVVLHLPQSGPRARFEIQRALLDVAVPRHGGRRVAGWLGADWITLHVSRRLGRCGVAAFGLLLASVFLALATQVESARVASIVLAGGAGAIYLSQSAFWAVTADIAGKSAGTVSGLMNMGGQLGGAVTASLTPWIAEHFGWTASFLTAAVVCLVGSFAWGLVRPDQPIPSQRHAAAIPT